MHILSRFQFGTVVNKIVINILALVFLWAYVLIYFQWVPTNGCTISHFPSVMYEFQLLHTQSTFGYASLFNFSHFKVWSGIFFGFILHFPHDQWCSTSFLVFIFYVCVFFCEMSRSFAFFLLVVYISYWFIDFLWIHWIQIHAYKYMYFYIWQYLQYI